MQKLLFPLVLWILFTPFSNVRLTMFEDGMSTASRTGKAKRASVFSASSDAARSFIRPSLDALILLRVANIVKLARFIAREMQGLHIIATKNNHGRF